MSISQSNMTFKSSLPLESGSITNRRRHTVVNLTSLILQSSVYSWLIMTLVIQMLTGIVFTYQQPHHQAGGSAQQHQSASPPAITSAQCNLQKYRPEGPVGIRFKKQILVNRDLTSGTFDSHMLESAFKKKHFLAMFDLEDQSLYEEDFQLQQLCPTTLDSTLSLSDFTLMYSDNGDQMSHREFIGAFCSSSSRTTNFGSSIFDQQSHQDSLVLKHTLANTYMSVQSYKPKFSHLQGSPVKGENMANGGIQIQVQGSGEQLHDIPKDNQYLNLALGVKASYELPIHQIEKIDQELTIEGFLFKKAKQNNVDNFHQLGAIVDSESKLTSIDMFQRYCFTYEEPEYIQNLTNGLKPNQIQKLKPQSSIYRYFTQEIEISAQKISFDECQLLIPKFEVIKITNKQRKKDIEIKTMLASSPELTFYLPHGLDFPLKLRPLESIEIKVAFTSETLGLFEALMYMAVDDWIYISTFNAYVVPNIYSVTPFYVTDLNINQQIELPLYLSNPSTTDTLIIEELYSTEEDVKLKWPHSGETMSDKMLNEGGNNGQSVIQHILVSEGTRKHIANMVFEINRTLDFYVEIHIRTSLHDIIRVPLYYHVHSDPVKFTPIDFGLVPLHFDILKIPIYAKAKVSEPMVINDILLPLGDSRLDFQMVDLTRSNVIRRNKETFLGYIVLNPKRPGGVESKITLTAIGQKTNKTYTIEIPIIGRVHSESNIFGAEIIQTSSNSSYPLPLVSFDVSDYISNPNQKRKVNEQPFFRQVILQSPLNLKNTFKVPIKIMGIVNTNPEIRLGNPQEDGEPFNQNQHIILQPGESLKYAQIELITSQLRIAQGTKYISINVNNTLIPIAIGLFERGLLCAWEEQEHMINLENIPLCTNSYEINFDYVAINDGKQKRLKITNVNPVNLTIETVSKQQLDDLNIYIEKVVDKNGNQFNVPQSSEIESMQSIIGPKRTKRLINFQIQPYQTLHLIFQILAKEPKQKFSRIDFQIKEGDSQSFSFNYKYNVISGSLTLVPQVVRFNPSYPGVIQQKPLIARSTFDVPITVKTIISNDVRVMPYLAPVVIKPNNKTEFGSLTFDSSKQPINIQSLAQNTGGGIPQLKEIEISNMFNQAFGKLDPMIPQDILQIINGLQNGGGNIQQNVIQLQKAQQMSAFVSPQDLENFREKQKFWDDQDSQSKGEVTSFITIETNVYQNITVPVRATLKKPLFNQPLEEDIQNDSIIAEIIDFDTVQIGSNQARSFKISNPTDEPLVVALFITTNEVYNAIYKSKNTDATRIPNIMDKDYFFQTLCRSKLQKNVLNKESTEQLTLTLKQNNKDQCEKIGTLINRLLNDTSEDAEDLRRQIENYFKDIYMAEQQKNMVNQKPGQVNSQLINPFGKNMRNSMDLQNANQNILNQILSGQPIHNQIQFVQFEQELENLTNTINQHSNARLVDLAQVEILKANYERQQQLLATLNNQGNSYFSSFPDFQTVMNTTYAIFKAVLIGRNVIPRPLSNLTVQAKADKAKKDLKSAKEQKITSFRLKNSLLNDVLINNETLKMYQDMIMLSDPFIVTHTGQNFFINPRYKGSVFKVEPKCVLTLHDAIIFQPQNLQANQMEMKLILKNNVTLFHAVDVRGSGGTGILEVTKVLKRSHYSSSRGLLASDQYVNAHTLSGQIFNSGAGNDFMVDYANLQLNTKIQIQVRERIIANIYGSKENKEETNNDSPYNREYLLRNSQRYGISNIHDTYEPNSIPFHLTQDDIFVPLSMQYEASPKEPQSYDIPNGDYDYYEDHESVLINRILERAAAHQTNIHEAIINSLKHPVKVQNIHKRVLLFKNTGNLPLTVQSLSIDDLECKGYGFIIENCNTFTLLPGEQHWLHIGYKTDFSIAKLKRKLVIETKQGVIQEYALDVNIPIELLSVANELMPLSNFEEWQLLFLKLALLAAAFSSFMFVTKDVVSHIKFSKQLVQEHEDRIIMIEDQSQIARASTKKDFCPPVLKDYILNDQVFQLYQQASDKLTSTQPGVRNAPPSSNNQQILLKEVANICSNKRNLVCLEAQKQAIDAEKESRRVQHIRNSTTILTEGYQRQQTTTGVEKQRNQLAQLIKDDDNHAFNSKIASMSQKGERHLLIPVQPATPSGQKLQESRDSLFSDMSLNDSSSHNTTTQQSEQLQEEAKKIAKVPEPKINKKLKRELAQRLKEQQEAEERFKKLQEEKVKEAEAEEKRKKANEIAAKKQKEQDRIDAEIREQQRVQQELLRKAVVLNESYFEPIIESQEKQKISKIEILPTINLEDKKQPKTAVKTKVQISPPKVVEIKILEAQIQDKVTPIIDLNKEPLRIEPQSLQSQHPDQEQIIPSDKYTKIEPIKQTVVLSQPSEPKVTIESQQYKSQGSQGSHIYAPKGGVKQQDECESKKDKRVVIDKSRIDTQQPVQPRNRRNDYGQEDEYYTKTSTYQQRHPKKHYEEEQEQVTYVKKSDKKETSAAKLTKDDLLPFFESQKAVQEIIIEKSPKEANNSSTPGAFGGSIFSYNPLNIFSHNDSNAGNKSITPDNQSKTRLPQAVEAYQGQQISNFNENEIMKSIMVDNDEEESKFEIAEQQRQDNTQSSLYKVFKNGSSLFSKPLFGATTTQNQRHPTYHQRNESFGNKTNIFGDQKKSIFQHNQVNSELSESASHEEESKMDEDSLFSTSKNNNNTSSLFSGSLFGESSIFGAPFGGSTQQSKPTQQYQPLSQYATQNSNIWKNNENSGNGGLYTEQQTNNVQSSQAMRRNIQSIQHPYHQGGAGQFQAQTHGAYHPSSSMTYQYPPVPPPGLGYRPSTQNQSLYSQYSGAAVNYDQYQDSSTRAYPQAVSHHSFGSQGSSSHYSGSNVTNSQQFQAPPGLGAPIASGKPQNSSTSSFYENQQSKGLSSTIWGGPPPGLPAQPLVNLNKSSFLKPKLNDSGNEEEY